MYFLIFNIVENAIITRAQRIYEYPSEKRQGMYRCKLPLAPKQNRCSKTRLQNMLDNIFLFLNSRHKVPLTPIPSRSMYFSAYDKEKLMLYGG